MKILLSILGLPISTDFDNYDDNILTFLFTSQPDNIEFSLTEVSELHSEGYDHRDYKMSVSKKYTLLLTPVPFLHYQHMMFELKDEHHKITKAIEVLETSQLIIPEIIFKRLDFFTKCLDTDSWSTKVCAIPEQF